MNISYEKSKEYRNSKGIYKLKRNNQYLYLKKEEIIVISENNFANSHLKDKINELNSDGYAVKYYHLEKDRNKYTQILPVVENKRISEESILSIKNKVVLVEGNIKIDKSNKLYSDNINNIKSEFIDNITIIVLNYNNKNIIIECINSLLKYNKYKYRIIIVDNGSTDGSYEEIKKRYNNKIMLLKNNKNGCSSGRNLGVNEANTDYLLFLDSDQIVKNNNWLDNYLELINEQNVIGWAAGWFNKKGHSGSITDNFELRCMPPEYLYRTDIGYLGSGGMFLSKAVFNKTNGFDTNFDPTGYEDTDLSLQIRNLGCELIYCPYLGIEHRPHQTTAKVLNNKKIDENANYFKNKWERINRELLKFIR